MSAGKKLNRAGTSTEIKITAVSLDKKNRQVYTVTVNRALEESASAASSPCFLTALQPSEGTLEPPFSPDILEYTLPVDSDVQSVTFQANASEGATVSINRKTLYKAGSTTEIVVTVRSEDRKTTKQYTVSVVRAEEGGSASERAGAGGTGMAGGNSGSNVAAKSNDGESPQSGEEPYIPFKVGETEEAAESAARRTYYQTMVNTKQFEEIFNPQYRRYYKELTPRMRFFLRFEHTMPAVYEMARKMFTGK